MKIAVASGKGGTGKTTVAVNLAEYYAHSGKNVRYLDCDVEEPNGHLFLPIQHKQEEPVTVMVPEIDEERCTHCGACGQKCQYGAIVNVKDKHLIFPELCHSCKLCLRICPVQAISEGHREVGTLVSGKHSDNIEMHYGLLHIGEAMAVPLIAAVKNRIDEQQINIIDAAPGSSCPVIEALEEADFIVMVTEPTPFGLHDLELAVRVAQQLKTPLGVVINRFNEEYLPLSEFLKAEQIPVLITIPEDKHIAQAYAQGQTIFQKFPQYRNLFHELAQQIQHKMEVQS